jgi:phosphate/phosphite/phosphonate ABC transporter binding protein
VIGQYQEVARLAVGGMAEIFLAVSGGSLERLVVIKRLLPQHADDPDRVEMFRREARYLAGLEHPNVVRIHELGDDGDLPYLVLEYIEGLTARSILGLLEREDLVLPIPALVSLGAQACAGLHAAHELRDLDGTPVGLIHRDISPDNLMVGAGGLVTVLDFGIATSFDRRSMTAVGSVRGKVGYLSPEQCRGEPLDRRSDVFSLGTVLWELTTGRRLFEREGDLATLEAITAGGAPAPSALRGDVPPSLDTALARALAVDPAERFRDAAELRQALLAVLADWRPSDASAGQDALALFVREHADWLIEKRRDLRRRAIEAARSGFRGTGALPIAVPSDSGELEAAPASARGPAPLLVVGVLLALAVIIGFLVSEAQRRTPPPGRSTPNASAPATLAAPTARATSSPPNAPPAPLTPSSAGGVAHDLEPLRIGWPPFFDPGTLGAELEPFAGYLSSRLDRPVEFVIGDDYDTVLADLGAGRTLAASLPPALFLRARGEVAGIEALGVREEDGRPDYDAMLLVRSDAPYVSLEDTQGARFCFTDRDSTSGYLLPRLAIQEAGFDPDAFVGAVRWSGDHLLALRDILDGHCDVVATYNGALVSADRQGIRVSRLRPLLLTGQVPQDVLVVSPALAPELRDALRDAIEGFEPSESLGVERVGEVLRLTGYAPFDAAPFDALEALVDQEPRL